MNCDSCYIHVHRGTIFGAVAINCSKYILVLIVYPLLCENHFQACNWYADCDGFVSDKSVICVYGECKTDIPCNKDADCAFWGKSISEDISPMHGMQLK